MPQTVDVEIAYSSAARASGAPAGKRVLLAEPRGYCAGVDRAVETVERALEKGIIINLTAKRVIRVAPPINIDRKLWDQGLDLVVQTIASL